ncbi:glycosyltransferase [Cytobacillus sp. Hz8]|uniref:MGDG synthase family glycosyltransferase n=1 Tax=Cytobacillus sp. Hz8 TaxID=3347168 RepID=UPI0035D62238
MSKGKNKKFLILSSTFGEGHNQVANAIREAVESTLPGTIPIILDTMEWIHPYLYPISNFFYKSSIKKFPQVYSYFYRKTRVRNSFSTKLNSIFTFGMHSILEVIREVKPSVVVSTYPFAAGILSNLKQHRLINIPTVTIITDYTDHSYWIYPHTDQYLVGTNRLRDQLILQGIEEYKIKVTGIPIRQRFIETQPREKLLKKYGMDPNKFTILMMGGGEGYIGKGLSTLHVLDSISQSFQLIIVCGRNHKLKKQFELEVKNCKHDVLLLGFCEEVQELMAISNLLITKPGGVTTSEALAMGVPLLIMNPLPGQEEDNANYLLRSGLAFLAKNEHDLRSKIQNFLNDEKSLTAIQHRTEQYRRIRTSSIDALNAIVNVMDSGQKQIIC